MYHILIKDDNICDLKAQYYAYLITYFNNQNLYLKCVESYKQIFDTLVKHPDFRPGYYFTITSYFGLWI
jgi:predicted DNA-binding protein (MmcQ/YjbR family)